MNGARETAVIVLDRIEQSDAFAAAALEAELESLSDSREVSLANELVLGVLRRRSWLDHLLNSAAKKGINKLNPTVLNILRVAVYQLVFLKRIPARAVVSEAVNQTARSRVPRLKGLVNALLRNLTRRDQDELSLPVGDVASNDITAMHEGLPVWIFAQMVEAHGHEFAVRAARAFNEPSIRTLRICTNKISVDDALKRLGEAGKPGKHLPWSVTVSTRTAARDLVNEGLAVFQDEGSGLVALALNPQADDKILDACAGRGGKTGTLSAMTNGQAHITAVDRHKSKLDRLRFELKKQGLEAETKIADLTVDAKDIPDKYERVLIDAPCSGTGTMGRRPEIRWRLTPQAVKSLERVQLSMLNNIADKVAPAGRLVYAVCSLLPQESAKHLSPFLKLHPEFALVKDAPENWPLDIPWNNGRPIIDPGKTQTDGYSILCFEKAANFKK